MTLLLQRQQHLTLSPVSVINGAPKPMMMGTLMFPNLTKVCFEVIGMFLIVSKDIAANSSTEHFISSEAIFNCILKIDSLVRIDSAIVVWTSSPISLLRIQSQTTYQIAVQSLLKDSSLSAHPYYNPTNIPLINLIYPDTMDEVILHLEQISIFYSANVDQVALIYFFIFWPAETLQSPESQITTVEYAFKEWVPNAPIHGNLYVFVKTGFEAWLWEFYTVRGIPLFQLVGPEVWCRQKVARRRDFRGAAIRGLVRSGYLRPVMIRMNLVNNTPVVTGGIVIDVIQVFAKTLNFSLEYVSATDWINVAADGHLVGMGEQLLNRDAEIAITPSELVPFRQIYLWNTQPFIGLPIQAYFRKPHPSVYRNVLVESFRPELWATFTINGIVIFGCLICVRAFKRKYANGAEDDDEVAGGTNAIFWTLAIFCQQGWHCAPKSVSLKIVALTALVSSLLYYTAYAASIVSIFSVNINPLRTIDDLIAHGFKLYGNNYSLTGLEQVKAQAKVEGVSFESRRLGLYLPEAIWTVRNSLSAFLSTRAILRNVLSHDNNITEGDLCPWLHETRLPKVAHNVGFFFRKFDPLRKYFDVELAKWRERGLLARLRLLYDDPNDQLCDPDKDHKDLTIKDLRGAYVVLSLGYVVGLVALVVERLAFRARNS